LLRAYASRIDKRKASFMICQSCYWCASLFSADEDFPRYPQCRNQIVDSLPIFDKEFHTIELKENGNVELWFGSE
jgi:hypothetical protein